MKIHSTDPLILNSKTSSRQPFSLSIQTHSHSGDTDGQRRSINLLPLAAHINLLYSSAHCNRLLAELLYLPTECQAERSKQAITLSKFTSHYVSQHLDCMAENNCLANKQDGGRAHKKALERSRDVGKREGKKRAIAFFQS